MIIIEAVIIEVCRTSSTRTISLGKNPDSGGNPPIERSASEAKVIIIGVLVHEKVREEIDVDDKIRKVINIEVVIRI